MALRLARIRASIPRPLARVVLLLLMLAVGAAAALHFRSSTSSLGRIGHPKPAWLAIAVGCELASLAAYALIVRTLLAAHGVRARIRELLRATVAGIALGASLPGGQAVSAAYWYKLLRREGAGRTIATVALTGSMLAGVLSLGGLVVAGVAVAGDSGPLAQARVPILVVSGVLLLVRLATGRRIARFVRRLAARFTPLSADDLIVGRRRLATAGGLAYLNWLFDCACLVAALSAVDASVPARSVLLTYALAQVVAAIPLLPGGGGTVELSLTVGFAAFGHTSGSVVAGVLLYRIICCWGLVPVGWLMLAVERGRRFRLRRLGVVNP